VPKFAYLSIILDYTCSEQVVSIVIPLDLKPIPSGYVEESTQEISVERIGSVIVSVKGISRINHGACHDQSSGIPKRLVGEFNIV